jgi:hypothetical protein
VVNPLEARTIGIRSVTAVTEYFVAATPPAEATSLTTRLAPQVRSALTQTRTRVSRACYTPIRIADAMTRSPLDDMDGLLLADRWRKGQLREADPYPRRQSRAMKIKTRIFLSTGDEE